MTEAALQFAAGKRQQMLKDVEAEAVIGWACACWWRWCQPVPFPGVYRRRIHRRWHRQSIACSVDSPLEHALDAVGTPWATTRLALQCHEMSRFHPGSRAGLVVEQPRPGAEESFAALRWGKADLSAAVAGSWSEAEAAWSGSLALSSSLWVLTPSFLPNLICSRHLWPGSFHCLIFGFLLPLLFPVSLWFRCMPSLSISLVLINMSGLIHIADLPNFLKPCYAIRRDYHSGLVSVLASTQQIWHQLLLQASPTNKAAHLEDVVRFALFGFSARHFQSGGRYWPTSMDRHSHSFGHWSRPDACLRFLIYDHLQIGHLSTERRNRDRYCSSRWVRDSFHLQLLLLSQPPIIIVRRLNCFPA